MTTQVLKIPTDTKYIWLTNLPNFSIRRLNVIVVEETANGDMNIRLENSPIFADTIRAKRIKISGVDWFSVKRCYHLTEVEAAERLKTHYKQINGDDISFAAAQIMNDALDKNIMQENIIQFIEDYPEMII